MTTLFLSRREEGQEFSYQPLGGASLDQVLTKAEDDILPLFFREPALIELARRGHESVLRLCEKLILSGGAEEWFVVLNTLEALGNDAAAGRLLQLCIGADDIHRRIILGHVARFLQREMADGFHRFVRCFLSAGVVDVTGWTSLAIDILRSQCQRWDIKVVEGGLVPDVKMRQSSESTLPFCTKDQSIRLG